MIKIISISNWVYLKSKLQTHYDNHLRGCDCEPYWDFKHFVEIVFRDILQWNSYGCCGGIDIIDNDDEFALDLLDAIWFSDNEYVRADDIIITVSYIETLGSLIVEIEPKPEVEVKTEETYELEMQKLKQNQLTKVARLLNELRLSKSRE